MYVRSKPMGPTSDIDKKREIAQGMGFSLVPQGGIPDRQSPGQVHQPVLEEHSIPIGGDGLGRSPPPCAQDHEGEGNHEMKSIESLKTTVRDLNAARARLLGMGVQLRDPKIQVLDKQINIAIADLQQAEGEQNVRRR